MLPLLVAVLIATTIHRGSDAVSNQPVRTLDLKTYLGEWHEIAHLPNYFQRKCASDVTATYTQLSNGNIGVHNACKTTTGKLIASDGEARTLEDAASGALKVRFAPSWLSWLPWVWADYWVIDLDADYQWAVVGSPSQKYLWILSRSPEMDQTLFDNLKRRAAQRGYPVQKLIITAPIQ